MHDCSRCFLTLIFLVLDAATDRIFCNYAHRMTNTRSHGSLEALFAAAGVSIHEKPAAVLADLDAELEGMSCPLER